MSDIHERESEFIERLRQARFDDRVRDEHRQELRERALAEFERAAQSPRIVIGWKRTFNRGRMIMQRPLTRYVAISAACVAVLALWMFAPGRQSSAYAFNRFANAIMNAKSARFEMEVDVEGQPKRVTKSYYLDPGKYRYELEGTVTVVDYQAKKAVTTLPKLKQAVVMNLKLADDQKQEPLDAFGKLRQLLDARGAEDKQYELLGEKEIGGRNTIGFRHETPLGSITMWGDPQTGMPVLATTVWKSLPPTVATMRDFQLDVELNPDLFDLAVPAGFKVQTLDADASKTTEADLIKALRALSEVDGAFPDALDTASVTKALTKLMLTKTEAAAKEKQEVDVTSRLMVLSMTIGRGAMFATQLPAAADAHYAGKGVKRYEPDRPVFWYKPEGSQKYRIIYADLSVKEASDPPAVADAQPVGGSAAPKKEVDNKQP